MSPPGQRRYRLIKSESEKQNDLSAVFIVVGRMCRDHRLYAYSALFYRHVVHAGVRWTRLRTATPRMSVGYAEAMTRLRRAITRARRIVFYALI